MDTAREQRDRKGGSDPPRALGRLPWVDAPWDAQVATVAVVGLFLLAAGLLGWRLMGATRALPPSGLWLVSLALLVGGFLLGGLRIRQDLAAAPAVGRWVVWMAVAAAGLLAAALSVPGASPLAAGVVWLVVGALFVWLGNSRVGQTRSHEQLVLPTAPTPEPIVAVVENEDDDPADDTTLPEGVDQEIVRLNDAEAGVVIQGRLRVPFAAGQRNSSVHIAFCPPLRSVPSIAVEVLSGPLAAAKVGVSFVQGARFDVRLEQSCDVATTVILAFFAQESSAAPIES